MALVPMDAMCSYEFWRDGCRMMAAASREVLERAGESVTVDNLVKFVSGLPREPSDLTTEQWRQGYCGTCLEKAYTNIPSDGQAGLDNMLIDYFLRYFPDRRWHCQEMLIDAFIGIVTGLYLENNEKDTEWSTNDFPEIAR